MLYKNVMVPYDGSPHALEALEAACKLVGDDPEATLHLVTVVQATAVAPTMSTDLSNPFSGMPAELFNYEDYAAFLNASLERARAKVQEETATALASAGCTVDIQAVSDSSIANAITDYAEEHGCDLIVMGRRGLGAIRGMLGSVSYAVLRGTEIPVLTVK